MFDFIENDNSFLPMAERMRPTSIDEVYGQKHILSENKTLRKMIDKDKITSMVFFGPPGVGKSTVASIIAKKTKSEYIKLNAVLSNVSEIREAIKKAEKNLANSKKTILFIDEIHRFNKSQQDALLPAVENGTIILIGSTTQNPYFYLTNALLSRIMLFEFRNLEDSDIKEAILKAIEDKRGLGENDIAVENEAIDLIVKYSHGDVRKALTYLEAAFFVTQIDETKEKLTITEEIVKDVTSKQILNFDEDEHYNTISAFIKSVRGSDTNAAIYYLARMLESGEDPRYIARRLCILASEDIGLAEPEAINIASSLINIIEFIGMPEGRIPLAEVTIYLSLCPKSNSAYKAIDSAIRDIRNGELYSIPNYLKDNNSASFDKKSEEEYKYPHDFPYHIVKQDYLEKGIKKNYYNPVDIGEERELKKVYEWIMNHIN
ncbi:replication-associated recombination protein A [Brachyspira aalborgi]|jgi:putative ATPase|uniref:Replication-associated recombination protein A n=1 Tax=Brachyspira aalborgi TaxID=29522 RepID=A0AB38PTX4_9SPIR|nr:replication-associated recombination protein A [Brachyspira aalborgi]MBS4762985.1 replication-associated recombination protein A [Brachyspira sp.]TXJ15577.1 replication-associated recombination protein A [Brachyspira aalborgi]TXJ18674.1 replication-associated recombination protein A [Brachyspira aalborgi]TXJ23966.1 replication-associated recombination protein A [Brachyspira aalborgi]TXJ32399.1 replication-associated recombination protein A [Brachyspira aalborgi]